MIYDYLNWRLFKNTMNCNEEEMVEVIRKHYSTCNGQPRPMNALRKHYGPDFKYRDLGLGPFSKWMEKNYAKFEAERSAALFLTEMDNAVIKEEDLLKVIVDYFNISDKFVYRRHVLSHIRSIFGNGPFGRFGFGTFKQFLVKHNLDMGIASRRNFKTEREWRQWNGRVER